MLFQQTNVFSLQKGVDLVSLPFDTLHRSCMASLTSEFMQGQYQNSQRWFKVLFNLKCVMLRVSQITSFLRGLGQRVHHRSWYWGEILTSRIPCLLSLILGSNLCYTLNSLSARSNSCLLAEVVFSTNCRIQLIVDPSHC